MQANDNFSHTGRPPIPRDIDGLDDPVNKRLFVLCFGGNILFWATVVAGLYARTRGWL
jgi:hypothetical protein